jgi:DNA-directed RNA polymerase sigma subunit (sigma70/sigma32)
MKEIRQQHDYKRGAVCSLSEVAAELGVSFERARQIERAALSKAKRMFKEKGYDDATIRALFE